MPFQNISTNLRIIDMILRILGLLLIPFAIYFLQTRKKKKELSGTVEFNTPLIGQGTEIKDDLKIFYKEELIEDLNIISLKLSNTGKVPISEEDFTKPIKMLFEGDILSANIEDRSSKSINPDIKIKDDKIFLQPLLLNPGEHISLKIIINNFDPPFCVESRIEGINKIKQKKPLGTFRKIVALVYIFPAIIVSITMFLEYPLTMRQYIVSFVIIIIFSLGAITVYKMPITIILKTIELITPGEKDRTTNIEKKEDIWETR